MLVVDDAEDLAAAMATALELDGYEVRTATDGQQALATMHDYPPGCVLLDIDMPRMDGIELVTLIRKDPNVRSLPVLIVSYKDREEDRRRGLDAGADYYLTKGSFHDETLVQAVVDLIGAADA